MTDADDSKRMRQASRFPIHAVLHDSVPLLDDDAPSIKGS
jgi:hypothetical protein